MNRRSTSNLFGAALVALAAAIGAGAAAPALAAEPSLTVNGAGGGIPAATQSLLDQARRAAAAATAGSGPTLYVDPNSAVTAMPGYAGLSAADQAFAQSIAHGYQLYKAMGGTNLDRQAVLQRKDGMYYVGLDGEGGRWFASAEQALGFVFSQLAAKDEKLTSGARRGVITCAEDILCAVMVVAADRYATIATVARGTTVTVTITGDGFSNAGGTPTVAATDGIFTESVTFQSSEKLTAVLKIQPTATLGENMVAVFNPGRSYQNVGAYKVIVTEGAGAAPTAENATRATAAALAVPATVAGKIPVAGGTQFFKIDVAQPGTLTVNSLGGSDLKGTLEDSQGAALATSDDEGSWYNFKLTRAVQPGTYYLRVTHCCGGTGAYQVSASLQ